jgi:hypothetical protein
MLLFRESSGFSTRFGVDGQSAIDASAVQPVNDPFSNTDRPQRAKSNAKAGRSS